jgi:type IV pilus assembly protein PilQ
MQKILFVVLLSFCFFKFSVGQDQRLKVIEQKLYQLAEINKGLNERTEVALSNSSLKEFLKGLAQSYSLSLDISPDINHSITAYFYGEKVVDVLIYCISQFNLDVKFSQSIVSIFPYNPPTLIIPPVKKVPSITFDSTNNTVTLDLRDDTLSLIANTITKLSNQNILVVPELSNRTISGYFQNLSIPNLLDKIAIANSYKVSALIVFLSFNH